MEGGGMREEGGGRVEEGGRQGGGEETKALPRTETSKPATNDRSLGSDDHLPMGVQKKVIEHGDVHLLYREELIGAVPFSFEDVRPVLVKF
jgi:hypothetical protein